MLKTSNLKGITALFSQNFVSVLYHQCLPVSISLIMGSYIQLIFSYIQLLRSSFNIMAMHSKILQYLQQQPYTEIRQ